MRTLLLISVLLALLAVCFAAPAPQWYFPRRQGGGFRRPGGSQSTATVTGGTSGNPNGLSFTGGLALASNQQVAGFGQSIDVNHAQAINENINIPGPPGFGQFNRFQG